MAKLKRSYKQVLRGFSPRLALGVAFACGTILCGMSINGLSPLSGKLERAGGLIVPMALAQSTSEFTIESIQSNGLDDGSAALDIIFQGGVPKLSHFIMASPPRVIVDIPNTRNGTANKIMRLDEGALESLVLVGDDKRLRLVLNLSKSSTFGISEIKGGYRLGVGGRYTDDSGTNNADPTAIATINNVEPASNPSTPKSFISDTREVINSIDFRRTTAGHGRVIVELGSPNIVVDFREQSGELIADFVNVKIQDKDERRLDVVDFATPVNSVDVFRRDKNVRIVVSPGGQYRHTVTQNDREFIIEVAPLTEQEITRLEEDESGYSGEVLSLNFQRIPVRAALQVIADFTGFNIITSDSVEGDLSLRLNDVPWDQALDLILQTKDLSMRQKGNVIRVAPTDEILAREKAEFEAKNDVIDLEPLITEVVKINFAKAEDLVDLIKNIRGVDRQDGEVVQVDSDGTFGINAETVIDSLLSARGSVTADVRTNTLIVQDVPLRIQAIRKLIDQIDVPIRQVQIETRIVEATDDFSRSLGARLGFTRVTQNARFPGSSSNNTIGNVFGSGSIEATNEVRDNNQVLFPDALSVNLGADAISGNTPSSYAFQIAKVGAGFLHLLDLEISALQADGKGKVIANPKISTTDKHSATIEQGQEFDDGDDTVSAVLSLTVTPQITPNDDVILDVEITNDSFADATRNILNTERITTQALLGNGETIVIGGIYKESQADTVTKTPFLGDLPLLGNLFKKRTKFNNRTELLVFLTPRILSTEF